MLNFGLFANCLQIEKAPEQRCALRPLFLWAPPLGLEPDRALKNSPVDCFSEGARWRVGSRLRNKKGPVDLCQ